MKLFGWFVLMVGKIQYQAKEKSKNHYGKHCLNINYIKTKNYSIIL